MSLNAATIEYLLSKGLTGDDLLEVARRQERRADPTAADRMARYREKRRNVTRNPPNDNISNPPPPPEPEGSSGGKRKCARPTFELPSIIPAELWAEFEAMRTRKKKPLTDFGRKQLAGKLVNIAQAGWNIEDVMAKAIVGCHDGFWMPDGRDSNIRRANEPRAGPVNLDEYRERLARIGKAEG